MNVSFNCVLIFSEQAQQNVRRQKGISLFIYFMQCISLKYIFQMLVYMFCLEHLCICLNYKVMSYKKLSFSSINTVLAFFFNKIACGLYVRKHILSCNYCLYYVILFQTIGHLTVETVRTGDKVLLREKLYINNSNLSLSVVPNYFL